MKLNVFNSDYFSSPDIRVYFGDIFIDELVHLEYQVQNNKRPLWGYRSVQFDAMAEGTYYVAGSFAINYRVNNFLKYVTTYFSSKTCADLGEKAKGLPANVLRELQLINDLNTSGKTLKNGSYDINDSNQNDGYQGIKNTFGEALASINMSDTTAINALFSDYQTKYWGDVNKTSSTNVASDRGDLIAPFKITIALGGFSDNPFDRASAPFTESIHDCYVTSVGKGIDTSGNPITDNYTFIAKDLRI